MKRTTSACAVALLGAVVVASSAWSAGCGGNTDPDTNFTSASDGGSSATSHGGNSHGGDGGTGGTIGFTTGAAGAGGEGGGSAGGCTGVLPVTLRDFTPMTNADFEYTNGDDHGIVKDDLGSDDLPVYAGDPSTPTTHSKTTFDQWYRDTPDVNKTFPFSITLTKGPGGIYTYDNQAYFPLDGKGFGNYGDSGHNFHFTTEVHTHFEYKGGEVFTFTGDDDLWTFINKKLAINLGGVHGAETASVDLDAMAGHLGIQKGKRYQLDVFGAERHTSESHFRIETTIGCFVPVPK